MTREPYISARDIAHVLRTPLRTIQRWASADGWRHIRQGRAVLYHVDDAFAGVQRRAGSE